VSPTPTAWHGLLGPGSGARLRACAAAGFAGLMFGRGADGATCACDAAKDGVTNPAPIDGNTRPSSSADDDGGYFKMQARAYYKPVRSPCLRVEPGSRGQRLSASSARGAREPGSEPCR
jgi:hypothetical protein